MTFGAFAEYQWFLDWNNYETFFFEHIMGATSDGMVGSHHI